MNGDRGTSPILVKALLDCYGVTDPAVREDVLDLVRADQAQRPKWWVITAMRVDLEHLLDAEPRTNITLQLLPFAAGFHPGLYRSFMLMGFPEPNPDVVWVENLTNSVYFEGSDDVGRYTEVFDHLRATALGPPETRSRIKSMLKEL
ncbi:DUF5753 domain-containing protein [Streptomyces sp. NPDC059340]|uniref:DUF5753 domain-containing protein n=1 Tax=Streptomyces sp. NPDC059340 TaxID=3346806 RepID=UPI003688027C